MIALVSAFLLLPAFHIKVLYVVMRYLHDWVEKHQF